jgi:hypothetical protein
VPNLQIKLHHRYVYIGKNQYIQGPGIQGKFWNGFPKDGGGGTAVIKLRENFEDVFCCFLL